MADKKSKFGIGLLIGAISGIITGIFFAPKSGKENREEVAKKWQELKKKLDEAEIQERAKEIFGEISDESVKIYKDVRSELSKRMDQVKEAIDEFDKDKYMKMVEDAVEKVKEDTKASAEKINKIKDQLIRDWSGKPNGHAKEKKTSRKV